MSKVNPIDDALGLEPIEDDKNEIIADEMQLPRKIPDSSEYVSDIDLARSNIQDIMKNGGDSLEEMISLAKQSESPRAFEVASTLMKTLLDANKEFVEMSKKKKDELEPKDINGNQTNVTNNNLVLSTSELLKMMKGDNE